MFNYVENSYVCVWNVYFVICHVQTNVCVTVVCIPVKSHKNMHLLL